MTEDKQQNPFEIQAISLSLLAIVLATLISGCTKSRNATLPEAVDAETFQISDLQNSTFQIQTSAQADTTGQPAGQPAGPSAAQPSNKIAATAEKPKALVSEANVPHKMTGLFQNRPVNGKPGASYPITMHVSDRKYITVAKIVKDPTELSLLEKQISKTGPQGTSVPLFKIPIKKIGVLSKIKNDIGDETSQFEFKETEVESATHVQVDLLPSNVLDIGKDPANKKELEQVFLESRLDKKVTTYEQLIVDLQVQNKEGLTGKVYSVIDSNSDKSGGKLFIYQITKLAKITDEALLRKLKQKDESNEIMLCSEDVLSQLTAEEQKDCVVVLAHSVDLTFVEAKMALKDRNDIESPDIEIEDSLKRSGLIKIVKRTPMITADRSHLDPLTTIRVADIQNKEFFFRRTFEDGASTITAFGPGASGALEIVKFELEAARVVVRRVLTVNGTDKNSSKIDKEELLSIPAKYLKRAAKTDIIPNLIPATVDQAEYISLDWSQNTIQAANSPLGLLDNGSCFQSASSQTITDLDMRLPKGMLNFSISGSYNFKPECMSYYGMNDYWYGGGLQSNFNLKERLSFRLNTGENDKATNIEIPFRAQNMLGFGIFTMGKQIPDDFGNAKSMQTETAMPVIQNFENGKKMTYILGGLPASGEVREALIASTRTVIQDWNQALRQAFRGSALDRAGNYIELQIDGVDINEGHLGDLDRNYIWNFEKNMDSGLLGLSQAGPNPRSGKIEQNNVLMYSGNLLSYIGQQKEVSKLQREYRELKDRLLGEAEKKDTQQVAAASASSSNSGNKSGKNLATNLIQKILNPTSTAKIAAPMTPLIAKSTAVVSAKIKNELLTSGKSSQDFEMKKKSALAGLSQQAYLQKIFQKATELNITHDETALNALSANEVLKAYGARLSPQERLVLSAQSRRLTLMAEFQKNFSKGPNCAMSSSFTSAGDLEKQSTIEIFSTWYSTTLSHEIGHSLGLTHNFQGSFDKANMKFAAKDTKDTTERNYSSIMDYFPDTHIKYGGPGPYDVHALRAIYVGKIELKDGSEISLQDYKKAVLGDHSWWQLDAIDVEQKPLKAYSFCTDVHVGGDPTCDRWDMGTTPAEVAAWHADEYRSLYPVMNSIGNRINIGGVDRYVSRVFRSFLALRPFMDETFFRSINNEENWQSYADGAIEALKLFTEVISTPDTTYPFADEARFDVVVTKSGRALIERKPSKDIMVPGFYDRVATRGIELDKVIATMMLFSRGTSNPRYEVSGLRVSFAEFEKYILGTEKTESMISLNLLKQMVEDKVESIATTPQGIIGLPTDFKVNITEMMRYYAVLSTTLYLSADAMEDKYDFSSVFRVGSSLQTPPKDRIVLTKLDQDPESKTSLKVWAFDNADFADSMIRSAAAQRIYFDNTNALTRGLLAILQAESSNKPADIKSSNEALVAILTKLNSKSVLITKEEAKAGESFAAQIDLAVTTMKSQLTLSIQLAAEKEAGKIDEDSLDRTLTDRRNVIESLAKKMPLIGIAENVVALLLKPDSKEGQILTKINSTRDLENNYGLVVNNLLTINRFVSILNPELNR